MADSLRSGLVERDIEQAITALKKGAYLLKYGRRGRPKFCPFHLSNDESTLIWYSGKDEKHLKISQVLKIIPGQRTAIFHRYPRPEKEYQSFSLICSDRSLDLICKDKDEAEVWFVGLKALISRGNFSKWRIDIKSDSTSSESPKTRNRIGPSFETPFFPQDSADAQGNQVHSDSVPQNRLGKAFSDVIALTAPAKGSNQTDAVANSSSSLSQGSVENSNSTFRTSVAEAARVSLSSAVSSSSQGSYREDFDAVGDVFIWGEGFGGGVLDGDGQRVGNLNNSKTDALLPKALESTVSLDVHNIACGSRHAALATKKGEIFTWGEESGGRLGHGVEEDVSHPKLINTLSGLHIELVACGEYHTCAVTLSGDLYAWGDGTYNSGMLGHRSEASHWIPKKVGGIMEGIHVSYVSCGPWHTAVVTSTGQLFTFGDGSFGALGHGDLSSTGIPREVETLKGLRTTRVACGVWHTAAIVEVIIESPSSGATSSTSHLFTWGNGDKGQLGHGDKEPRLVPECVDAFVDENICRVSCGHNLTVALTNTGQVYTMGSTVHGQLGSSKFDGKYPTHVEGKIADNFVEDIACGSYHVAVFTSKAEVYTWGKGSNGQLGHGDMDDRDTPTLVQFFKDKQVKSIVCGSNFTAIICLHKRVTSADHSICSSCRNPFGFRRKRHNCYNCGLVFCKACSSRKSLKASLAPSMNKPYRVCDDCFVKLKKSMESSLAGRTSKVKNGNKHHRSVEPADKEILSPGLLAQLPRPSSADSVNHSESRRLRSDSRVESNDRILLLPMNGNFQLGCFFPCQASTSPVGTAKKVLSITIPSLTMSSRSTSPASARFTPQSSESISDNLKQMNGTLSQEVKTLKARVEDLTRKSQYLQGELERTSKQLKEVTTIAEDEAEKYRSAKEVIKSLTAQLKEKTERRPETNGANSNSSLAARHSSGVQNQVPTENHIGSISHNSRISITQTFGTKTQTEKVERVVQDEPGVYITLCSLPMGGNELKRIRFSRKHFTEEQAEKWWAENGSKVCERHSIRSSV